MKLNLTIITLLAALCASGQSTCPLCPEPNKIHPVLASFVGLTYPIKKRVRIRGETRSWRAVYKGEVKIVSWNMGDTDGDGIDNMVARAQLSVQERIKKQRRWLGFIVTIDPRKSTPETLYGYQEGELLDDPPTPNHISVKATWLEVDFVAPIIAYNIHVTFTGEKGG